jgi:hypothetical protein
MAPALDSGGTPLPKSYTRVALARAGRTSRTSNENNTQRTTQLDSLRLSVKVELGGAHEESRRRASVSPALPTVSPIG